MNIKKKLAKIGSFFTFMGLIATAQISYAQLSFNNQATTNQNLSANVPANIAEQLKGSARFNGALIGFGMRCNVSDGDVKKVQQFYINNINRINLSEADFNVIIAIFNNAKDNVRDNVSTQECRHIRVEFEKILQLIN